MADEVFKCPLCHNDRFITIRKVTTKGKTIKMYDAYACTACSAEYVFSDIYKEE